jgi:hypothetical protein
MTSKLRIAILVVTVLANEGAWADDNLLWTVSRSGGSEISIPVFMTQGWVRALMENGEDYGTAFEPELYPVQLRQYRTKVAGRPYEHLSRSLGATADEITYSYDKSGLGAISGFTNDHSEMSTPE